MVRTRTAVLGTLGALGVATFGAYAWRGIRNRSVERVSYDHVDRVGPAELRAYPRTLVVETVAPTRREAFLRLFGYLSGGNAADESLAMTAPVAVEDDTGESVPMTAPVRTEHAETGVRMAFFLPSSRDFESAPRPTDATVRLVEVPARTLAVVSFSWWPTERRVERHEERLSRALADADLEPVGEPFLLGYDAPGTLPFLRTNEVAVEVRDGAV